MRRSLALLLSFLMVFSMTVSAAETAEQTEQVPENISAETVNETGEDSETVSTETEEPEKMGESTVVTSEEVNELLELMQAEKEETLPETGNEEETVTAVTPLDVTAGLAFDVIDDNHVKFTGRVVRESSYLRTGFCGSGLEFNINAAEDTNFVLTYSAGGTGYKGRGGRSYDVRIYVDAVYSEGVLQNPESDHLFECLAEDNQTMVLPVSAGQHHIEVFIESQMPRINREADKDTATYFHFDKVQFNGTLLARPADKDLFIEFVGASGSGGCAMEIPYYPGCIATWDNANASKCHVNILSKMLDCDVANVTEGGLGLYGYDSQEGVENAIQLQDLYPYVDYKAYWNNEATFDSYQGGRQPDICFVIIGSNDRANDKDDYDMWKERARGLILDIKARRGSDTTIIWAPSFKKPLQYRAVRDLFENDPEISKYNDLFLCSESRSGASATSTIGGQLSGHADEYDQLVWAQREERFLRTHGLLKTGEPVIDYIDYYVSENGNDTTGDGTSVTPYQTIPALLKAIQSQTFPAGKELRIYVSGTVNMTGTQVFAQLTSRILRTDGTPLPITIETKDFDDTNRAVLKITYSPSGTGTSHFYSYQPITFRNVQISSVTTKSYAVSNLWAFGSKIVFDNTTFLTNTGAKWNLYASAHNYNAIFDGAINGTSEMTGELVFKNGTYDSSMLSTIATNGYSSLWKSDGNIYNVPGMTCKITVSENAVVDGNLLKFNNSISLPVSFAEEIIEVGTKGKVTGDFVGTPSGTSSARLSTKNNFTFILNGGNVTVRHFQIIGDYIDVTGNIHFRGISGELETDGTGTETSDSSLYFAGGASQNTITGNKHVEITGGFYHVANPVRTPAISSCFFFGGGGNQIVKGDVYNEIHDGVFMMDLATLFDESGNIPKVGGSGGFYFAHASGIIEGTLTNRIENGAFETSLTSGKACYLGGKNVLDCINRMVNIIGTDDPGKSRGPSFSGCELHVGSMYGQYGVTSQVKNSSVPDGTYDNKAVETTIYGGYFYRTVYLSPMGSDYASTGISSFVKGSVDIHIQCGSFESTTYLFGGRILGQANAQIDYGFIKNLYGTADGTEIRDGLSVNIDNIWSYSGCYEGFTNVSPKYFDFYPCGKSTVTSVSDGRKALSFRMNGGVLDDLHLNALTADAMILGDVFYEINGGKFKTVTTSETMPAAGASCIKGGYFRTAPSEDLIADGYSLSYEYDIPLYRYTVTDGEPTPALHDHCYCGGIGEMLTGAAAAAHVCDPSMSDRWTKMQSDMPVTANTTSYYFLDEDITLNASKTLAANQKVYICLNGHTLSFGNKFFLLGSHGDCELYICDCKGTGRVVNTSAAYVNHASIAQLYKNTAETYSGPEGVKMEIYGGTFIGSISPSATAKRRGGQFLVDNGILNIFGGTFLPNPDALSGTVYPDGGFINSSANVNIYGGTVKGFKADVGGSIYSSGALRLYGGEIIGGQAVGYGGNIYASGDLTVADNAILAAGIAGCDGANKTGGNLYVASAASKTIRLLGGTITGGTAVWGANFYCGSRDIELNGTCLGTEVTLSDNTKISGGTAQKGGNIYVEKKKCTINSPSVIANGAATGVGGGNIYATSELVINGAEIRDGQATGKNGCGGNIYLVKDGTTGTAVLNGAVIKNGKTGESGITGGGNVYIEGATATFNNCTVSDGENRGGGNGGNITMKAGKADLPELRINGGKFLRGKAKYSGTNIYITNGTVTVNDYEGAPAVFTEGTTTGTTTARNIVIGPDAVSASFTHAFFESSDTTINIFSSSEHAGIITVRESYFVGKAVSAEPAILNGISDSYFTNKNVSLTSLYDDPAGTAKPYIRDLGTEGGVTVNETYFRYKSSEGYTVILQAGIKEGDLVSVIGLSGAGMYEPGEKVSISAFAETNGYRFIQWKQDGNTVGTDAVKEITVTSDIVYTAVYQYGLEALKLQVYGTGLSVTTPEKETKNAAEELLISPAVRGQYVLEYTDTTRDFMYWADGNGNVISKANPLLFDLSVDASITAVSTDKEKSTVLFRSLYGQIIRSFSGIDTVNAGTVTAPSVPVIPGKCGEWTFSDGTGFTVSALSEKLQPGNVVEIVPEYQDLPDQTVIAELYLVELNGKTVPETSDLLKQNLLDKVTAAVGEVITLSGTGTGNLAGIYGEDAVRLSKNTSIAFRAIEKGTKTFFLVYTDETVGETTEPAVGITEFSAALIDEAKYMLKISMNYDSAETVLERGILYSFDTRLSEKSYEGACKAIYKGSAEAFAYVPAGDTQAGSVTLLLKNITDKTLTFYARAYVVYRLSDGTEAIKYSDISYGNIESME